MENKIPTSEEYFKPYRDDNGQYGFREIEYHLREFAKLHTKFALECAAKTQIQVTHNDFEYIERRKKILNSYPLDDIK